MVEMYSARCARRGERRASKSEQRELHVASATPFQTRGMPACTGRYGPCHRVAGGAGWEERGGRSGAGGAGWEERGGRSGAGGAGWEERGGRSGAGGALAVHAKQSEGQVVCMQSRAKVK